MNGLFVTLKMIILTTIRLGTDCSIVNKYTLDIGMVSKRFEFQIHAVCFWLLSLLTYIAHFKIFSCPSHRRKDMQVFGMLGVYKTWKFGPVEFFTRKTYGFNARLKHSGLYYHIHITYYTLQSSIASNTD